MKTTQLHSWNVTIQQARSLQKGLAGKVRLTPLKESPSLIAGLDCAFSKTGTIGTVLRTHTNVKPVFVSLGHKCTIDDAAKIVLACSVKYRIPEPTRLAHKLVSKYRITI